MEIITISNRKGGVGKSTTSQCLAIGLIMHKKRVLVVDLDSQCNTSYTLNALNKEHNVYTLLKGSSSIEQTIYNTKYNNLDIIPSCNILDNADNEFTKEPYISLGAPTLLKNQLDKVKNNYDYIIIDTPPNTGILTLNALVSCDYVIIPTIADIYSIQGLTQLTDKIKLVKSNLNPNIHIKGLLLTMFTDRTNLNKELKDVINNFALSNNTKVYPVAIRQSIAVKESQVNKSCILLDNINNNASLDYITFTKIILNERED